MNKLTNRLAASALTGMLAISAMAPATAFADVAQPSAGAQTSSGATDVTIQQGYDPNEEYTLGDDENITFSVVSSINFVVSASGEMTGPDAEDCYVLNKSNMGVHVSSFDVDAEGSWNIIGANDTATADNSVAFQFGVQGTDDASTDMLDAADYLDKADVSKPALWNMAYNDGSDADSSKVKLSTSGNIHNVTADITQQTKIATITTYIKPSLA